MISAIALKSMQAGLVITVCVYIYHTGEIASNLSLEMYKGEQKRLGSADTSCVT